GSDSHSPARISLPGEIERLAVLPQIDVDLDIAHGRTELIHHFRFESVAGRELELRRRRLCLHRDWPALGRIAVRLHGEVSGASGRAGQTKLTAFIGPPLIRTADVAAVPEQKFRADDGFAFLVQYFARDDQSFAEGEDRVCLQERR